MSELVNCIRKEIGDKVLEFIKDPCNKNKILLIPPPQGVGKSVSTLKALLETNIKFIWLSQSHLGIENLLNDQNLKDYDMFHLKGRKAKVSLDSNEIMCQNDLLDKIVEHNFSINDFLCNRCEFNKNCLYRDQFNILEKTKESWIGVYQFLWTEFLKNYQCDVVIIDEYPLGGLQNEITFNTNDLDDLYKVITKIFDKFTEVPIKIKKHEIEYFTKCYSHIVVIIEFLIKSLSNLPSEGLSGKPLIDAFVNHLGGNIEYFEHSLNETILKLFFYYYKNELYTLLVEDGLKPKFKNIVYDVIKIARDCLKYKDVNEDINFSTLLKRGEHGPYVTYYKVIKELPDKPIIILDATGNKEVYQNIFGREVIVFNPSINIKRNIVQITEGMYPKASLFFENTRLSLFSKVTALIKHWVDSGECDKVFVITHMPYATLKSWSNLKNEKYREKYKGLSIEQYFIKHDLPAKNYRIMYFGQVKGLNISDLMSNGRLIIIGTPEPNIYGFLENVRSWYVGEPLIINDRIEEPPDSLFFRHDYRCKDERYMAHLKMEREHRLEHAIERVRFVYPDSKKLVVLWTMLPIGFETRKMRSNELMKEFVPEYYSKWKKPEHPMLKPLIFIKEKEPTKTEFCQAAQNWKFVKDGGGVKRLEEILIQYNWVKHIKYRKRMYLRLTKIGEERLKKIIQ